MPGRFGTPLGRERLWKNEIPVDGVGKAQRGSGPKRKTYIHVAKIASDGRTDYEAESKRSADQAESLGAFLRWSHVGDVGKGGGDAGGCDARNEATNEKPAE